MNRCVVTKRIIQGVAVAFGVLGVMLAFMGLGFAVTGFRQSDRFMQFFMTPMFLALGGITVAIRWVNLRHFGAGAIRHITALVVVSVYLWLPHGWNLWSGRRLPDDEPAPLCRAPALAVPGLLALPGPEP
jgi:hypothetical protein